MNCTEHNDIQMLFIDEEMYYKNVEEEITFCQKSSVQITNVGQRREKNICESIFQWKIND